MTSHEDERSAQLRAHHEELTTRHAQASASDSPGESLARCLELAEGALSLKRAGEARQWLDRVVGHDHAALRPQLLARALDLYALWYTRQGLLMPALAHLKRASRLHPAMERICARHEAFVRALSRDYDRASLSLTACLEDAQLSARERLEIALFASALCALRDDHTSARALFRSARSCAARHADALATHHLYLEAIGRGLQALDLEVERLKPHVLLSDLVWRDDPPQHAAAVMTPWLQRMFGPLGASDVTEQDAPLDLTSSDVLSTLPARWDELEALLALELLRRALEARTPQATLTLEVSVDGASWFRVSARHQERVDITTRASLKQILCALVDDALGQRHGVPLTELIKAGWPDEKITPDAAQSRVYTALYTLRELGLEGLIESHDRGYRLAPQVEVKVCR